MPTKRRIVVVKQEVIPERIQGGESGQRAIVKFDRNLPRVLPASLNDIFSMSGKFYFVPDGFVLVDQTVDGHEVTKLAHKLAKACSFLISEYKFVP